ncbi:hypothetical protein ACWT_5931 [Actinoplanes sp. SE50]|uniref:hypothetical protein n=1 Tax=unclassified Actinoplanes TaxID=2626549 RepID=UPI00023EC163|nr:MULTISPECIES: hypothetical protein [unclassified Actinoplanes]AEV86950.1 hypothetical protein ACPL_6063 [Actinoplanes sp. SE50/110]ATO85346.1 hypothetical protein ACWT_5931 [Actinoplanes sp. SE50]SLM02757.1 hypothetical protein ACSP50_6042 [Actinoplanes sp. SE50/110]
MSDSMGNAVEVSLPSEAGVIVDLAPISTGGSAWLFLDDAGQIGKWDRSTATVRHLATTTVPDESGREPWNGRVVRRRLHASADGAFAAVVNDYGRFGEVLDLGAGGVTLTLDGGGYEEGTVPFSLVFAEHDGATVVVHRTNWNRLDVSHAGTGALVTARSSTSTDSHMESEHGLDYFHGALYLSPDGRRILDDGWVWHPVGFPVVWRMDQWLSVNPWESEDGQSRMGLCGREYYWDHPMVWIDETRVAVEGIGDDADDIRPGARLFDTTRSSQGGLWREETAVETACIPGPSGRFFSDGVHLFSSGDDELAAWDLATAALVGVVRRFAPTHYNRHTGEFLQLSDENSVLVWAHPKTAS